MTEERSRRSVQSGSCDGWNTKCVLQRSDCPADTQMFLPSRQLPTGNAHGGGCRKKTNTELDSPLGRCAPNNGNNVGETSFCAGHPSLCENPNDFQPAVISTTDADSDNNNNSNCNMKESKFGFCGGGCYWSSDDCPTGQPWTPQVSHCTCDHVHVGACLFNNYYWCAVSADSCQDPNEFVTARDLLDNHPDAPLCYLCRATATTTPFPTPSPTIPPKTTPAPVPVPATTPAPTPPRAAAAPVPSPTTTTTNTVTSSSNAFQQQQKSSSSNNTNDDVNMTAIVVVLLVVLVAGVATLTVGSIWRRKNIDATNEEKQATTTTHQDQDVPPMA